MDDVFERPKKETEKQDVVTDLMIREDEESERHDDKSRVASSVKEIASRIPESLSAIGRDISRTIERAISVKDDYVIGVMKLSHETQEKVDQLVQAGLFKTRAEAASFLIEEGIKAQTILFESVKQKIDEIERLRAELRGMVKENKA